MITGKLKNDFAKWCVENQVECCLSQIYNKKYGFYYIFIKSQFDMLRSSTKFALLEEFADEIFFPIHVNNYDNYSHFETLYSSKKFKTRKEAQGEAIKQFNICYNGRD